MMSLEDALYRPMDTRTQHEFKMSLAMLYDLEKCIGSKSSGTDRRRTLKALSSCGSSSLTEGFLFCLRRFWQMKRTFSEQLHGRLQVMKKENYRKLSIIDVCL